jgi:hypothetical protein
VSKNVHDDLGVGDIEATLKGDHNATGRAHPVTPHRAWLLALVSVIPEACPPGEGMVWFGTQLRVEMERRGDNADQGFGGRSGPSPAETLVDVSRRGVMRCVPDVFPVRSAECSFSTRTPGQ